MRLIAAGTDQNYPTIAARPVRLKMVKPNRDVIKSGGLPFSPG
ncbi:hypothetical protein [Desulfosporosinus orientis]|nr:hypothetical protein [Desulfosporosinus orientis]